VAPKGGLGVSTLALNLALMYHQRNKVEVIAAELRPGQGTWSIELGQSHSSGLCNLLHLRTSDINLSAVENELVRSPYGIRLLLSSAHTPDQEISRATEQLEAVVDSLPLLSKLVFLDIGTNTIQGFDMLLNHCNELLVVTEPFPSTVYRTRQLVEDLQTRGYGKSKLMTVVSINRIRADVQLTITQMQEILGQPVAQVIPPAPELAYQAAMRTIPLAQVQVGNIVSLQFSKLAEQIAQRVIA
jgi:pilus assembly protein CpaE